MGDSRRDWQRILEDEKERWFSERRQQVERARAGLRSLNRRAMEVAPQLAFGPSGVRPDAVRALGAALLDAQRRNLGAAALTRSSPVQRTQGAPRPASPRVPPSRPLDPTADGRGLRGPLLQADTAVRSAANLLTFNAADSLAAATDALITPGGGASFRERYAMQLAEERDRNALDSIHRRTAQQVGELAAMGLLLSRTGPAGLARLPGASALSVRENLAWLAAGAGAGAGMQSLSDEAFGRRSTAPDLLGAAVGGVVGAASRALGPSRAAAVDGWTASLVQDALNGRPPSWRRANENAVAGRVIGGVLGQAGRIWSDRLSPDGKGRLGEFLGHHRSILNGVRRDAGPKERDYLEGGIRYWVPDGLRGLLRFEDKFGPQAALSANQKLAQEQLGPNFILYHSTPETIGRMTGLPGGPLAPSLVEARNRARARRGRNDAIHRQR